MEIAQVSIKGRKQSVVYFFNGIYCTVKEIEQLDKHSSIVNLINIMLSESETPNMYDSITHNSSKVKLICDRKLINV